MERGPGWSRSPSRFWSFVMPMVNGKKYPYTKSGKAAAKKAAAKKKGKK